MIQAWLLEDYNYKYIKDNSMIVRNKDNHVNISMDSVV